MFSYIKGTLEEILEGQVVVESHGVGYQICTPKGIVDELPPRGEAVKIYTYFSVKEDGVSLYGFSTKEGRRLFGLLLKVNGIGPKGALGRGREGNCKGAGRRGEIGAAHYLGIEG